MAIDISAFGTPPNWIHSLPADLSTNLLKRARLHSYLQNDLIYDLGDAPGGIYGIVSGVVGIGTDDNESSMIYGHLMGRGAWIGENAVLTGSNRQVAAVVLSSQADIASVSFPVLNEFAEVEPRLWKALAALSAQNAQIAIQTARDLMIRDADGRCLAVLRRIANSIGANQSIPISQEELAEMCGVSRGALSKSLGKLEGLDLLKRGYRSIELAAQFSSRSERLALADRTAR